MLKELRSKAIEELKNNDELLIDVVNELDIWNGYADGFRSYPMYELNDLHYGISLSEFLDRITSDFNHNDEYFYYSIYGLESTNDIAQLYRDNVWEDELLDNIIEHYYDINLEWIDSDFNELIEALAEAEESEATA